LGERKHPIRRAPFSREVARSIGPLLLNDIVIVRS
jgi:hypothetical protein